MPSLQTMTNLFVASLPWLLLTLPAPVSAQDSAPLDPIIITASRTPETTADSPGPYPICCKACPA